MHEPDAPELVAPPDLQAVFARGHLVGELARERFPGGTLIEFEPREVAQKCEATQAALAAMAPAVFEAAFVAEGVFAAVDVLERRRGGFVLVEVKSTLDVKEQFLPDVAIQLHVLRAAGVDVRRAEVMHLNRGCCYPRLEHLFTRTDVTEEVELLLPAIPQQIRDMQRVLEGDLPEGEPGPRCTAPYECPFMARCWPALPEHHLSTLYKGGRRVADLLAAGVETIQQLPASIELPSIAARQIRSVRTGEVVVEPELAAALARLEAPLAYLDFETIMPAVPMWNGCHPYEQVPVQMSCHVVDGKGRMRHHEF